MVSFEGSVGGGGRVLNGFGERVPEGGGRGAGGVAMAMEKAPWPKARWLVVVGDC